MAGSRRRRQLKKQQARDQLPPAKHPTDDVRVNFVDLLSQDLLAKIHYRLGSLDRVAFAVVCKTAGHPMNLDAATPWIVFPGRTEEKATFFPLADGRAASARTSVLGTRGHVVVGSSFGWLATADELGGLQILDPFTGDRAELPDMSTMPFVRYSRKSSITGHYHMDTAPYLQARYAGQPPPEEIRPRSRTLTGDQMRQWFFGKVVLAASPRPDSYAAMLVLDKDYGVPAFVTAADQAWKVAPSRDGVEDAIHHDGRFYSVSYSGAVEAWERDGATGEYTSKVVAVAARIVNNMVVNKENFDLVRKYIAAMPDGRLAVVLKYTREVAATGYYDKKQWSCVFMVQVLDAARGRWKGTMDIGDAALFVGMNSSFCVSAAAHPGIKPGCVYFTDDELHQAAERREREASRYGPRDTDKDHGPQHVGVYNLKNGTVEVVEGLGSQSWSSPPVWFTPSL